MKADWLRYDAEAGRLWVTDRQGKEACYVRGPEVSNGGWDVEMSHAGDVIRFEESRLRTLPERIVIMRSRELMPVTGLPKPGATDIYFEFMRQTAE